MVLAPPSTLSPSKLTSFSECGLQFRFSAVDKLPEPPSVPAVRGTLVHAALERLHTLPAAERTRAAAHRCLAEAHEAMATESEWRGLALDPDAETVLVDQARQFVDGYFALEDPTRVHSVGIEMLLSATVGGVTLRGIIDRLDLVDGDLVVTDYKTGRSPSAADARARMLGVHVYALLVEQNFGRRPVRVQLLHLGEPEAVVATPTDQSTRGLERRILAAWEAIERACEHDDFAPRPGPRCSWCAWQAWCPTFGGDPARAAVDVEIARRSAEGQDPLFV